MWPYDGAKTGRDAAADSILVRDVVVESLARQLLVKADEWQAYHSVCHDLGHRRGLIDSISNNVVEG